ncbi:DUF7427 family protein [Mycobacterium malmoense]|uniref:DUF7427 family protein n=1 Tax=Mycobacterium malmoense TaxID=1780 RepID=UPI0008F965CE|nr:hypothetical protein [Mycobacterium malmoense]OIN80850.1 hypothetical protein BMG05_10980 [Mycobacterium malmoense]
MRPADREWLALVARIVTYEATAPHGELLSEGVDRYRAKHRWLVTAVIVATALHLLRWAPPRLDLYRQLGVITRAAAGAR